MELLVENGGGILSMIGMKVGQEWSSQRIMLEAFYS